jgi:hypothetical protein
LCDKLQVFDGVYLWKRYESRKFLIPFWFNAETGQVRARRRRRKRRRRRRRRGEGRRECYLLVFSSVNTRVRQG